MFIAVLNVGFHLHGCHSLKEKRQRLRGLRDKFGALRHVAVCEGADNNNWQDAEWSFVCASNQKTMAESTISAIVEHCAHGLDAELVHRHIEWL